MYGVNCVGNRTRTKKKQEESTSRSARKDEENKKRRRAEKKANARYCSSDEDFDIIMYSSDSEDSEKGKAVCRNKSRKISTGGGETSKYKAGNELQEEIKGNKKQFSHRYAFVISSDDDDDFDGRNSKDAELVASVAVPSPKVAVEKVKKRSEMNPHSRVGSRNTTGKNKSVPNFEVKKRSEKNPHLRVSSENRKGKNTVDKDIQEHGEDSSSDDFVFLDNVKDIKKGKNLPRHVEKNPSRTYRTCNEAVEAFLISSDDDGDSKATSSEDEESVPSTTDSDSEKASHTSEDLSSSAEDLEDSDFEISGHKSSRRSKSDASSDDEEDRLSCPEQNLSCPPIGQTERKSAGRQQSSKVVESGSSTSSHEDSLSIEEEKVGQENEETNQFPKASRRRLRKKEDDAFNILANSILHQGDMLEKMAFEQRGEQPAESDTRLPLKFSFDDEIPKPPEKSDLDKEVEELYSEMLFALECEAIDSDSQPKSDEEDDEQSKAKECKHVYVIEDEIGLICRHCRHVKTEIRHILPSFATRAKRFARGESSRKEKGFDTLEFESSSDSHRNASFEADGTVWDSLPGVRHTLYQHQREGFELLWRNIGGSIELSQLSASSSELGGCIISHALELGKRA